MRRSDYLRALWLPALLVLISAALNLAVSVVAFQDVSSMDEAIHNILVFFPITGLLAIFGYAIFVYLGWSVVKKFKGKVWEAVIAGLLLGLFNGILAIMQSIVLHFWLPGYKLVFLGAQPGILAITGAISIPIIVAIDSALSAVGASIAEKGWRKRSKK